MTIGRFAPSPSGRMHLGNAFSALLAWLSARQQGGEVVLRIEDLDPARSREEYALQIMEDMRWLGLDWDRRMPDQSTRGQAYDAAIDALSARGLVYPCFCSRGELHAASAPHASDGRVIYAGTCRDLPPEEIAQRRLRKSPAWRLRLPDEAVTVQDGLQGVYAQNLASEMGDIILRRADGVAAYQLAVVLDDAAAGVTEVVRGRDLLSSTPTQIFLHRLLGLPAPRYYHVPMLLSGDGRRLSKRDKDIDFSWLRAHYSPEQVVGLLAFWAGLQPRPAPVSARELVPGFAWDRVPREDIVADCEFLCIN